MWPFKTKKKEKYDMLKDQHVKLAFTWGGEKYYELTDVFDTPCERAFSIRDYMEELSMRCTREFLQAHVTAVNNILTTPKMINLPEVAKLNGQLQERLDLIIDTEIVKKVAAAYFFDKTENPYTYSYKYGMEKIRRWEAAGSELDFFLLEPVKKLANYSLMSAEDLKVCMYLSRKANRMHLEAIFTHLSEIDKKKDFAQILYSQMQPE